MDIACIAAFVLGIGLWGWCYDRKEEPERWSTTIMRVASHVLIIGAIIIGNIIALNG